MNGQAETRGSIKYGLYFHKICKETAEKRLEKIIAELDLTPLKNRFPFGLYPTASNNVCVGNNINKFNPNDGAAHLFFSAGANDNTIVGGHGTVIDLGANNTFKGHYRDLTGRHLTTPRGVGNEISNIKDWWDLPWE